MLLPTPPRGPLWRCSRARARTCHGLGRLRAPVRPTPRTSAGAPLIRPWGPNWRNTGGTEPSPELPVSKKLQVSDEAAGELACRPGSVHPRASAGRRPSIWDCRYRQPRAVYPRARAGRPQTLAQEQRPPGHGSLLTLLRVGFTEPPGSPRALVVSYTTVSPLPPANRGRSVFCGTIPRVTPGRRYRPPCPAEPGPSSTPPGDQADAAAARPARPLLRPG